MTNLGQLQVNQKMTGVKFQAQDANGDPVVSFNGLTLSVDQTNAITFANQAATTDLPVGSTFTVDIIPTAVTSGAATITAVGQQGNGLPTFTSQAQITVVANPNAPGPPVQWVITAGAIVSQ